MLQEMIQEAMDKAEIGSRKWSDLLGLKIKAKLLEEKFITILPPEGYIKEEMDIQFAFDEIMKQA